MLIKKICDISGLLATLIFNIKLEKLKEKYHLGLVTTTTLNTKIGEVENKMPDAIGFVWKTDFNAKISDIEAKYFTTSNYNKFTSKYLKRK